MSDNINIQSFQLFAEDGAVAGGDISATADATGTAANVSTEGVATGGDAEQIATATGEEQTPAEDTWESLIKGKYKKEYGKAVQQAVSKRMRTHQAQHDALDPLVQGLAKKYGITPAQDGSIPIDALVAAYNNDNEQYEDEAYKRGMSVEELKNLKNLERENARLRQAQQQEDNNRYWAAMEEQARALKGTYPDLDFATEMENPEFAQQLAFYKGADPQHSVERAYRNVHFDEIMSGAIKFAVERTNTQISNAIQSGSRRPVENGVSGGQSTAKTGAIDPSKLSKEQLKDYIDRAKRGERITFS